MSYLIDTNVLSELRKGKKCDPGVAEWFGGIEDEEIYLSVLTVGEIRRGVESVRGRDPGKAAVLERWLQSIQREHADRILPIDLEIGELWGRLSTSRPLSTVDALMGATALAKGLLLVTRNTRHFAGTGVECLNPFSGDRPRSTGRGARGR